MSRSEQVQPILDTAEKVEKAIEQLFAREETYAAFRMDEAVTEHEYKITHAAEVLAAEGTEKARIAAADNACADLFYKRLTAKASSEIAKEKLLDTRAALSARQTILKAETDRAV